MGFVGCSPVEALAENFKAYYLQLWWSTKSELPALGNIYDLSFKKQKQKEMDEFIQMLVSSVKEFPKSRSRKHDWNSQLKDSAVKACRNIFGLNDSMIDIFSSRDFSKVTGEFLKEAKSFDSELKIESILQALRNVWIMNSIQILLGIEVGFTPSVFAYSMLYPYTDNYLDNPDIPETEKQKINHRLKMRLEGAAVTAASANEQKIFSLIEMIEGQYGRADYPEVYQSLLGIHSAQIKSLAQQRKAVSPYEADILGISFEKGGMSVLADAYLIKGKLEKTEAAFAFGFGILLQLADDLQDADSDFKNRHMTVFSQTCGKWPLDGVANRLFVFMFQILDGDGCFKAPEHRNLRNVMKYNCTFLMLQAIAKNKKMFTREYIRNIEGYSRFTFRYLEKIYDKLKKEYFAFNKKSRGLMLEDIFISAVIDA